MKAGMINKVTASPYHNQMMRCILPLNEHFGIKHFWYYKITFSGFFPILGHTPPTANIEKSELIQKSRAIMSHLHCPHLDF